MPLEPSLNLDGLGLNLEQYFGLWAIEESQFMSLFDRVSKMDLALHVRESRENAASAAEPKVTVADRIAMIEINGVMTKRGSSMSDAGATSLIRRQVRLAANDPQIGGILLVIDSPGGTVSGTADLGADVAAAADKKPVYAFIEDLGASAAYWVASQASKAFANDRTAVVGSIGTFMGLYDFSGAAAMSGIRPVVIQSGEFKGSGFAGTQITDDQKAYWQALIDKTQAEFTAAIARGRKMSVKRVNELADGRIHMAADAQLLGLIDGIQSFEETVNQLQLQVSKKVVSNGRPKAMSESKEGAAVTQEAATFQQIKASCIGADAAFIVAQLEAGSTIDQARSNWMGEQNARLQKAQADAQAVKSQAATGVEPLKSTGGKQSAEHVDAIAAFNEAVEAHVKAGAPKAAAIKKVVHSDRDLYASYIAAVNEGRQRPARAHA